MDAVLGTLAICSFLLVLSRVFGRRTLSEITTLDFVLLLIIGEATQQAMLGEDFSEKSAFIVIGSLLVIDIVLLLLKEHVPFFNKVIDGVPMVIVENAQPRGERMKKACLELVRFRICSQEGNR